MQELALRNALPSSAQPIDTFEQELSFHWFKRLTSLDLVANCLCTDRVNARDEGNNLAKTVQVLKNVESHALNVNR